MEAFQSFQDFIVFLFYNIKVVDTLPEIITLFSGEMWSVFEPMVRWIVVATVETMGLALDIFLLFDINIIVLMFIYVM